MNAHTESFNGREGRLEQNNSLSSQIISDHQYLSFRGNKTSDPSLSFSEDGSLSFGSPYKSSALDFKPPDSALMRNGTGGGESDTLRYLDASHSFWGEHLLSNPDPAQTGGKQECETGVPGPSGSSGLDGGSSTANGSDAGPGTNGLDGQSGQANPTQSFQQEIGAIVTALEQALQQSGGDPTQFWQDFMNDLNNIVSGAGSGSTPGGDNGGGNTTPPVGSDGGGNTTPPVGSDGGGNTTPPVGSDGGGNTTPPVGSDGGSTTPPGSDNGGTSGSGNASDNTKLNSLVQFDPSVSPQSQQAFLQVLDNQPPAIKQALLQSQPTIQILPDQGNGLGGYYDSGSNTVVAYDGPMGAESFGHELFHAADAVTGWSSDPALQQALSQDITNNPGGLQLDGTGGGAVGSIALADGPTIQTSQGPVNIGDIFAEASNGITDANTNSTMSDNTGTPAYIAQNFPNFFNDLKQVENA